MSSLIPRSTLLDLKSIIKRRYYDPRQLYLALVQQHRYNQHIKRPIIRRSATKIAVIIHLYYIDSWPFFVQHLQDLRFEYDIFISLPDHNASFVETIYKDFPRAQCFITPNRGRDVLPFLYIAYLVDRAGYIGLLKMHSKKSTHRPDGQEWFSDMIKNLLPKTPKMQRRILNTLERTDTGIIGPAGQYMPLTINFEANGVHMTRQVNKLYDKSVSREYLQANQESYGFFAGTMFWARLDALRPVLAQKYNVLNFETEEGQIDATFAHALERVFCVVCEIDKKILYEIDEQEVKAISYKTDNIPEWSNLYRPKT